MLFFLFILLRNWVFVTNFNFRISISVQPDVVNPWYFKQWTLSKAKCPSLEYTMFTTLACKDIGIRKFNFVVKTQFFKCQTKSLSNPPFQSCTPGRTLWTFNFNFNFNFKIWILAISDIVFLTLWIQNHFYSVISV